MKFLNDILKAKQLRIAESKAKRPQREIIQSALKRQDAIRGFRASLDNEKQVNVIAEIKRASPSRGDISRHLVPSTTARMYEEGGASALSVLTEQDFFFGSLDDMVEARNAVKLPVLCKDFIIDEYQIYEAFAYGADAILIIVRILNDEQLDKFHSIAGNLGICVLTEVYDEADCKRAIDIDAKLIGINNRDLETFDTNIDRTIGMMKNFSCDTMIVSLSGITNISNVQKFLNSRINRFLIGEALVKEISFLHKIVGLNAHE